MPMRITLVDHPLVQHKLAHLRDKRTGPKDFRELAEEVAMLMAYEAMRDLELEETTVETGLGTMVVVTESTKQTDTFQCVIILIEMSRWIIEVIAVIRGRSSIHITLFIYTTYAQLKQYNWFQQRNYEPLQFSTFIEVVLFGRFHFIKVKPMPVVTSTDIVILMIPSSSLLACSNCPIQLY